MSLWTSPLGYEGWGYLKSSCHLNPTYKHKAILLPRDGHTFCRLHPQISLSEFKMADFLPPETGYSWNQSKIVKNFPSACVSPYCSPNRMEEGGKDEEKLWLHTHFGVALPSALMFCHPWQDIHTVIRLANVDPGRSHRNWNIFLHQLKVKKSSLLLFYGNISFLQPVL